MKVYYDLHIHTCLSPCGHEDMTPNNIVNMCCLKGLNMVAITDHNTVGQCGSVMEVAKQTNLVVIPGMELETREGVHIVCLFPSLETALSFERVVDLHRLPVRNRPESFGHQWLLDAKDAVVGEETISLLTSTYLNIDFAIEEVRRLGGFSFPAHIDRPSYSVLSNLGFIAPDWEFTAVEISCTPQGDTFYKEKSYKKDYFILRNSDAHQLAHISESTHYLDLSEATSKHLFAFLKNAKQMFL